MEADLRPEGSKSPNEGRRPSHTAIQQQHNQAPSSELLEAHVLRPTMECHGRVWPLIFPILIAYNLG